jgi:polyhydroxyalkanoate synthase subunit PhaC
VLRRGGMVLYRYGRQPAAGAEPLLIVYALVNRPEMADLQAGRSLIGGLVARGFDVYLVDWGYPSGAERLLGLDDYVNDYLDACVEHLRERLGRAAIPLLGICQGGTFSACYSALNPAKVSRLITTVTPIDFHTPDDLLSHLIRHVDVEALVASCGNVSGDLLNALFLSLKPYRLTQQKYLRLLGQLDDREAVAMFLRMEQWIFDSPALTAQACREFAREFYQGNRLARGELRLGGRAVALANITMPVLNIYARDDHLVPPAASQALGRLVGTAAYTEAAIRGGHIGIYVGATREGGVAGLVQRWMQGEPLVAAST